MGTRNRLFFDGKDKLGEMIAESPQNAPWATVHADI